jgi:hypothetical protein
MSNAYTNQVLFGYSKSQVNREYMEGLIPYMLFDDKLLQNKEEDNIVDEGGEERERENEQKEKKNEIMPVVLPTKVKRRSGNTIFWSIYEHENPNEVFFGTRANEEIEQRIKVVEFLKKNPKRLKDTNSKLTLEQTNALFGAMMVSKEEKRDFCIAYSVYYNKSIMIVFDKTYCIYSPTSGISDSDVSDIIILRASESLSTANGKKSIIYCAEQNNTEEMIAEIRNNLVLSPLKSISNYKSAELNEIAHKLQIDTRYKEENTGKDKSRKKEDIYNDIRVAIHKEQN